MNQTKLFKDDLFWTQERLLHHKERMKSQIIFKLRAHQVSDLSDKTLTKVFEACVLSNRFISLAKILRDSGEITIDEIYKENNV